MKDIPNYSSRWGIKKLGDVAELNPKTSKDILSDDLEVDFIPMRLVEEKTGGIAEPEKRRFHSVKQGYVSFANNDILFAKVTPCMENGKIAIVNNLNNNIGFGSSEFHVIRVSEQILNSFLFYFLIRDKFRSEAAANMTGAVGLRRVPKQFLENYILPLPTIQEQKAIVNRIEELFSEIDAGKELLKALKEQLKIYQRAVLKNAFEGKLTNQNVIQGKIPDGWDWVRVRDIAYDIQYGHTEKASNKNVGPKFLRITDIQDNRVAWEKVPYCKISKDELTKKKLKDGDLVFARTGATVGKSFLIKGDIPESVFASYLIRIRFPEHISDKYVWYFFQSNLYWQQIFKGQVGTGQPNVNGKKLGDIILPLPSLTEQQIIVKEIESCFFESNNLIELIDTSLHQNEILKESILQQAFEGKLKKTQTT